MILSIFLCVLTCIASVAMYYVSLYGSTENSFEMLCSKDEFELIDEEYILPFKTDNSQKAAVMCKDYKDPTRKRLDFTGYSDCRLFKATYETEYFCKNTCSGFGDCIDVCPQNAIFIENGVAKILQSCNGCGLCIDVCPQNLIKLIPADSDVWIDCIAPDCYKVNEKIISEDEIDGFFDPMRKKIEYSKKRHFKIWQS